MTNRILTALAIRFAALLMTIKMIDQIGWYFTSFYQTLVILFMNHQVPSFLEKIYLSGTLMIICNIILTCFLFLKSEWIASKLIKKDNDINSGLSPQALIRIILLTTGIIWLSQSIFLIPDFYDFLELIFEKNKDNERFINKDFRPITYLLKTTIAIILLTRVGKISSYLETKIQP